MKKADDFVVCSTFESESFLRDLDLARLPAISDKSITKIIMKMDEIFFTFCKHGDVLLTRNKMSEAFTDYIASSGFVFFHNSIDVADSREDNTFYQKSIFQLLYENNHPNYFYSLIGKNRKMNSFAAVPYIDNFCMKYGIEYNGPSIEALKRANSKVYSTMIRDMIGVKNYGSVVRSLGELKSTALELLSSGPILIKDAFGVAGKGSIQINHESILVRICDYLQKQEKESKRIEFIVEPFLQKSVDFSCQLFISPAGSVDIISLHKMNNIGLTFNAIYSIDEELKNKLYGSSYFSYILSIGKILFHDGYHGNVCIDSMILKDGEIVPIVEINARMSMSNIKLKLDKHFNSELNNSILTYYSLSCNQDASFETLLDMFNKKSILLSGSERDGMMLLNANSFEANRNIHVKYKSRLYVYLCFTSKEKLEHLLKCINEVFKEAAIDVLAYFF